MLIFIVNLNVLIPVDSGGYGINCGFLNQIHTPVHSRLDERVSLYKDVYSSAVNPDP